MFKHIMLRALVRMHTDKSIAQMCKMLKAGVSKWADEGGWKYIHATVSHVQAHHLYKHGDTRLDVRALQAEIVVMDKVSVPEDETPSVIRGLAKSRVSVTSKSTEILDISPIGDLHRRIQEKLDQMQDDVQL